MNHVIIGGGVIGLSLAYELSKRNQKVTLLEKNQFGKQASWAGAGILIPANPDTAIHAMEHLEALSQTAHAVWAEELQQLTQIDNGFQKCGGLYLARTNGEVASLTGAMHDWTERQITFEETPTHQLTDRFGVTNLEVKKSVWVPGESQISNPDHLRALILACEKLGVEMRNNISDVQVELKNNSVNVSADGQNYGDDCNYIFSSGPWTEGLTNSTQVPLPMQPVRGQIVLYKVDPSLHQDLVSGPVINEGSRYLVPRRDGHILAGSTIEEVGFECTTTEDGINDVRRWAESLIDSLESTFVKAWAGLRPATYDGFPYLGQMGQIENAFVATGHFKGGLHLSTGTAIVLADQILGKSNPIDISCLSPNRAADHQSTEIK